MDMTSLPIKQPIKVCHIAFLPMIMPHHIFFMEEDDKDYKHKCLIVRTKVILFAGIKSKKKKNLIAETRNIFKLKIYVKSFHELSLKIVE